MKSHWTLAVLTLLMAVFLPLQSAWAGAAGTVTHVSGPFAARKADGKLKALSIHSSVESGDMLITEKRTYARIRFVDNSEITLKPNSQFKVEEFGYTKEKPGEDKAAYRLVKGGLRAVTGQIGKRGAADSYSMKTPTATIGVRGTSFTADYIEPEQQAGEGSPALLVAQAETAVMTDALPVLVAKASGLAPGLYIHVLDGTISLTNQSGMQFFSSGQFGYVPSYLLPPQLLRFNPGLHFTPPPAFSSSLPKGSRETPAGSDGGGKDCEVR
jgi:hypothetical protein